MDFFPLLQEWKEEQRRRKNVQWAHVVQFSERFRWRQDLFNLHIFIRQDKMEKEIVWLFEDIFLRESH